MINITITGLDMYLSGEFSEKVHDKLCSIYEIDRNELVISGVESFVFHQGVEQNSYQGVIKVEAEEKYQVLQTKVAKIILEEIQSFMVHASLYFIYFKKENYYEFVNNEYPRFLSQVELVEEELEDDLAEEEEVYTGDIFKEMGMEDDDEGECSYCDDEDCSCEDGECHCHDDDHDCEHEHHSHECCGKHKHNH